MNLIRLFKRLLFFIWFLSIIFLISSWKSISQMKESKKRLAVIFPVYTKHSFNTFMVNIQRIDTFIRKQVESYSLHLVQQTTDNRFNRGYVVDIGYDIVRDDCDYIAIHEAHYVPAIEKMSYRYPMDREAKFLYPDLKDHQDSDDGTIHFEGGAVIIRKETFEKVNGMSTGIWGGEAKVDYKNFLARLQNNDISVSDGNATTETFYSYWWRWTDRKEGETEISERVKTDGSGLSTMYAGYRIQKEWAIKSSRDLFIHFHRVHIECTATNISECIK